jgi:hypothetical protein
VSDSKLNATESPKLWLLATFGEIGVRIDPFQRLKRLSPSLRDSAKLRLLGSFTKSGQEPKLFATEMNGRRPTPIFATNLVSEERDLALRGFVSPLGNRARQTLMSGSLGTLALYATPPIQSIRQSWASSGKAPMA